MGVACARRHGEITTFRTSPPRGGGGTPRSWTPTTPLTNHWPKAPGGGGGGSGRGFWEGRWGAGCLGGALRGGVGRVGWGGIQVGRFGVGGGGGGTGSPYLHLPSL